MANRFPGPYHLAKEKLAGMLLSFVVKTKLSPDLRVTTIRSGMSFVIVSHKFVREFIQQAAFLKTEA